MIALSDRFLSIWNIISLVVIFASMGIPLGVALYFALVDKKARRLSNLLIIVSMVIGVVGTGSLTWVDAKIGRRQEETIRRLQPAPLPDRILKWLDRLERLDPEILEKARKEGIYEVK